MLAGQQEFVLVDDQKVVYETALSLAKCATDESKQVVIVQGGPGTGKSVVAINLLVALTALRLVAKYVTKMRRHGTYLKACWPVHTESRKYLICLPALVRSPKPAPTCSTR